MTDAVNFSRAPDPNERKKAQTRCKNNHLLGGWNLLVQANGGRACRECAYAAQRRYREKKMVR